MRHLLAAALFDLPHEMRWFRLRAAPEVMKRCELELDDMRQEALRPKTPLLAFHAGFLRILALLNTVFVDSFEGIAPPLDASVWKSVQYMEGYISQGVPFSVKEAAERLVPVADASRPCAGHGHHTRGRSGESSFVEGRRVPGPSSHFGWARCLDALGCLLHTARCFPELLVAKFQ